MDSSTLLFFLPEEVVGLEGRESEFFLLMGSVGFALHPSEDNFNVSASNLPVCKFLILLEGARMSLSGSSSPPPPPSSSSLLSEFLRL
jgi:hypothetical protein